MSRAVVFAYHNVGVRCLSVLLAHGVDVATVVTHEDNPNETIWFDSVAELAARHDIPVITPEDPNNPAIVAGLAALQPDFLFSFYYRLMLKAPLLALPKQGAWNMHGSLLPKNPALADFLIRTAVERRYGSFDPVAAGQTQAQRAELDRINTIASNARRVAMSRPR